MRNGYYNREYFHYQIKIGQFGGFANLFKFEEYVKPHYNVLDFGCGGGFLLMNLRCRGKIGVEINRYAREQASKNGIDVYRSISLVPDGWADVIISNHVLEHVECPLRILRQLKSKLKKGGKIIFVVPFESFLKYKDDDINKHLYTWNPQCLVNLFKAAGYKVIRVDILRHLWPPYYSVIYRFLGKKAFDFVCKVFCLLIRNRIQIRVVGQIN